MGAIRTAPQVSFPFETLQQKQWQLTRWCHPNKPLLVNLKPSYVSYKPTWLWRESRTPSKLKVPLQLHQSPLALSSKSSGSSWYEGYFDHLVVHVARKKHLMGIQALYILYIYIYTYICMLIYKNVYIPEGPQLLGWGGVGWGGNNVQIKYTCARAWCYRTWEQRNYINK